MYQPTRRDFLAASGGALGSVFGLQNLAAAVQANSSPHGRPKLKITDVRTAQIRAHGHQVHVRIYTDQGIYGHGEATDSAAGTVPLIERSFRRMLIGQDPLNVDLLWERLRTRGIFAGAQAGQYVTAMTGIEIALWDLAGKALGLPIYQLLGGKMRDRIRIYADVHETNPPTVQKVKDLNFTALKIDIDNSRDPNRWDMVNWTASNGEIDNMVGKVERARNAFDPRVDLAVDMHGRYDMTTGRRMAKELESFRLMFLEEPVPAENVDAMRDVRETTSTPICCGENIFLRHGFRTVLEKRAADIIMPDIQKCGGLLESRKIADMAHTYYVPVAPHCVVSPIGTMASCHVCAAIPNFLILEWHWIGRLDYWRSFAKEGEIIKDGFVTVPDAPGIGVEMDEDAARVNQARNTPWFQPVS